MIITQVHLVLGTKGHSKMCSFVTMPQMSEVSRERAIGMLTAGMSTRTVVRQLNVNFATIKAAQDLNNQIADETDEYFCL